MALAERRSFPDTLFFVARGIVGETWSVESAAAVAAVAVVTGISALVLPLRDPRRGERKSKTMGQRQRRKQSSVVGGWEVAAWLL